jgi:hypothetical protein
VPYTWGAPIYTDRDYTTLYIDKSQLYPHNSIRINYTAYDMRRGQDSLKSFLNILPGGVIQNDHSERAYIMLPADEDQKRKGGHPFWYAQVLGIFHVNACDRSTSADASKLELTRFDILWIRWLGYHPDAPNSVADVSSPRAAPSLFKVGFIQDSDEENPPYGFIDPTDVIRAAHLIPNFKDGGDVEIEDSAAHGTYGDWAYYNVARYGLLSRLSSLLYF